MNIKHVLTYFPIKGRGEPVRLAFVIGQLPFTHKVMPFDEWRSSGKSSVPLGQIPVLDIVDNDGNTTRMPQSNAILRYIGRLGGLYSNDDQEALMIDSLVDTANESSFRIEMTVQNAKALLISDENWSSEQVQAIRERIISNTDHGLPHYLGYFEEILKKSESGWLVGDKVTIADLSIYRVIAWLNSGMLDGIPKTFVADNYPAVEKLAQKIEELPAVKAYYEKYGYTADYDYKPE